MKVNNLSRKMIVELKGKYLCETQEFVSWSELADADKIVSDEEVFSYYADVDFTEDDFGV